MYGGLQFTQRYLYRLFSESNKQIMKQVEKCIDTTGLSTFTILNHMVISINGSLPKCLQLSTMV